MHEERDAGRSEEAQADNSKGQLWSRRSSHVSTIRGTTTRRRKPAVGTLFCRRAARRATAIEHSELRAVSGRRVDCVRE